MNANDLKTEIAAIVKAATDASAGRGEATKETQSAITKIRTLAVEVNDGGLNVEPVADYLYQALIAAKVPKGSALPYKSALKGYVVALNEGIPVELGHGPKGDKPMTAPAAREFAQYTKAERDHRANVAAIRQEINGAIGRATAADVKPEDQITMLNRILKEVVDIVPEAVAAEPGTVTTTVAAPDDSLLEGLFQAAA